MKRRKTAPYIWFNAVNLNGLYSDAPIKCTWDKNLKGYWSKKHDIGPTYPDRDPPGIIEFVSKSKAEVTAWTRGVQATMTMLRLWAGADK